MINAALITPTVLRYLSLGSVLLNVQENTSKIGIGTFETRKFVNASRDHPLSCCS